MTVHAITVVGRDRPGIIAETTERLAGLGLNLEDSSMTLLGGHFAMTLVCAGTPSADSIREALQSLAHGSDLTVTVGAVPDSGPMPSLGPSWVLTVHGGDRPGIVSGILAEVAAVGGNVTDLTTRLTGDLYLLVADVELPPTVHVESLRASINAAAARLGVGATLRLAEADNL